MPNGKFPMYISSGIVERSTSKCSVIAADLIEIPLSFSSFLHGIHQSTSFLVTCSILLNQPRLVQLHPTELSFLRQRGQSQPSSEFGWLCSSWSQPCPKYARGLSAQGSVSFWFLLIVIVLKGLIAL